MEKYDYMESVREDVRTWIANNDALKENYFDENGVWLREDNRSDIEEELNDTLWTEDSVTGNGSGSYTMNTWEAEENLCHNLDLLGEALKEFGCGADYLVNNCADACDVTIRCYLLATAISEVLDEIQGVE